MANIHQAGLAVEQIPVLTDNYIYLITCKATGKTAVVDPAVTAPVIAALGPKPLDYIINTHHHADHTGANLQLKQKYGCTIIGAENDAHRIPGIDQKVKQGDVIHIGAQQAQVFETPGHTTGHIVYYFAGSDALFCGDTLFIGGCGRLFEGTAQQMFESLQKIKKLPPETRIFCAHEYTLQNYKFLHHAAPNNPAVSAKLAEVESLRAQNKRTVPATLGDELKSNLFLTAPSAKEFAALRDAKDRF